jgi:hypothetical protein
MDLERLHKRLFGFFKKRYPEISIGSRISGDSIKFIFDKTILTINPKQKSIGVSGKASQIAYAMGRKLGNIYYAHWKSNLAIVKFPDKFRRFPEKAEIFILIIALFRELELSNYFIDKTCLLEVNNKSITVKVYVTSELCVLIARSKIKEKAATIEIKDEKMIDKLKDPKEGSEVAKKKAKEILSDDNTDSKRKAIYGDVVEGTVKRDD